MVNDLKSFLKLNVVLEAIASKLLKSKYEAGGNFLLGSDYAQQKKNSWKPGQSAAKPPRLQVTSTH